MFYFCKFLSQVTFESDFRKKTLVCHYLYASLAWTSQYRGLAAIPSCLLFAASIIVSHRPASLRLFQCRLQNISLTWGGKGRRGEGPPTAFWTNRTLVVT